MESSLTTPPLLNRIAIIGVPGAGKSTLSATLAARLNLQHVELDGLFWEPNWVEAPTPVMLARVDAALPADGRWVSDGNYAKMREVVWMRGQTLIWLDYSLGLTLWRLLQRTVGRVIWNTDLWGTGNHESIWRLLSLDPDKNLLVHNVKRHALLRARFEEELGRSEHAHLNVLRFQSQAETDEWLASLPAEVPVQSIPETEAGS